jgi:DNA-binding transcriptional regulator YiaG
MLSRAVPIMLETGTVREWVGISSDIHDSKVWSVTTDAEDSVLTGAQIRAARGIVNWSVRELSEAARVSSSTIRRLEESNEAPTSTEQALGPIRTAFEGAGVEFLFPPAGKPGVRPT